MWECQNEERRTKETCLNFNLKQTKQKKAAFGEHCCEVQCHLAFHVLSCYHVLSFMTCMDLLSRTWPVPESTSNMEYQKLFTVHTPHSLKTLNGYSWYCDHHCHRCCLYTSVSYRYATQKQKAWLILGDQLFHHFRGTVFLSHWMTRYCISCIQWPFFVVIFKQFMCNWDRMFPAQHKTVQCHYQQLIRWHGLSLTQNNVKDELKNWTPIFLCNRLDVALKTLGSSWLELARPQPNMGACHFSHIALISCWSNSSRLVS